MSRHDHTRIRWGILSTGHIASVLTRDLALLPDEAAVVAVGSRSLAKAEQFAADYQIPRAYGSYAELAADPEIDVVYVASTHNDHLASARLCLEAGKAVLVEKPLTVSAAEAEDLITLAGSRGLFLMEALWTRTNPLLRRAAEAVEAGELGAIRHVTASFGFAFRGEKTHRLLDPDQAGGAILDLGVYPVHGVNLFLGEPDELYGFGTLASTGVESHAAALLTFPGTEFRPPATASIVCSLEADLPTRLEVQCSDGSVRLDNFLLPDEMTLVRGIGDHREEETLVTQWSGGGYTFEISEVNRCLRAGELESSLVPWRDTLAVARTLDRWLLSIFPPLDPEL
ncbi:MAG: Gfo/Idh/MocA family oxidoreductase [Microlunatus sp.]|nr:Gfo/Idh/MocA family oxidoreductase [Microlunatus sp.]MDN5771337.1 Gfo/Idh/MocA family oxidoreductase [Microlunatus sp.]